MPGKGKGSDIQGGWSRGERSRNQGRFRRIRTKLGQVEKDGSSIVGKSLFYKLYNVLQFRIYQLARWRYWKDQWKENI